MVSPSRADRNIPFLEIALGFLDVDGSLCSTTGDFLVEMNGIGLLKVALREVVWVISAPVGTKARSDRRQHAGKDLEPEVLLVAEPVRAALEDADLVVQPLDEAERDLVLRAAIGRDPVPVPINHRGEFLVRPQALPLEGRPPVLEEPAA